MSKKRMKTVFKSTNKLGGKTKTYVFADDEAIVFYKLTVYPPYKHIEEFLGGEQILKQTERYILTVHMFPIKVTTLNNVIYQYNKTM